MRCVIGAALSLGGPGRVDTWAFCCVLACPSPLVGPLWVLGVLWPAGVFVWLVLCGLLAVGVLIPPMVWALQVM